MTTATTPDSSSTAASHRLEGKDEMEATTTCDLSLSDDSDDGGGTELNNVENGPTVPNEDPVTAQASNQVAPNEEDEDGIDDEQSLLVAEGITFPSNLSGLSLESDAPLVPLEGSMIGSKDLMEFVTCPCCQQATTCDQTTLNEPDRARSIRRYAAAANARAAGSLMTEESEDEDDETTQPEDVLPGVLAAGVEYRPTRILVEGWLHKKGTGQDWLGSRAWKSRWARLCLARVEGYEVDVPLLLMYWYPNSTSVSTVIVLDSTVVLAVDLEDKSRWNSFRFEIRHASTRTNATMPTTRTFSAPQKARDAWVYAISQALLMHAKEKDAARKNASLRQADGLGHGERPISPTHGEVWTGDRFLTVETRPPTSPPVSPRTGSQRKTPLSPPSSPQLPRPAGAARRDAGGHLLLPK